MAHSYGVLGTLIAAASPERVRSLTLIEPPLYFVAGEDPGVAHVERLGDEMLTKGLDMDPLRLREFLRLAGAPVDDEGPLGEDVERGVRRAHGGRLPGEAHPDLAAHPRRGVLADPLRAAPPRSGGSATASRRARGSRRAAPGAGHRRRRPRLNERPGPLQTEPEHDGSYGPGALPASPAMWPAIARHAVAAGEGALRTCTARSE